MSLQEDVRESNHSWKSIIKFASGRYILRGDVIEGFNNKQIQVDLPNTQACLWSYTVRATGQTWKFVGPAFEVDGNSQTTPLVNITMTREPVRLSNGCLEYSYEGALASDPDLLLQIIFRLADDNPVVRFYYALKSRSKRVLTKTSGRDGLTYLHTSFAGFSEVKEVRFSEFNEMVHSFCLAERTVDARHFNNELCKMGPMLLGSDNNHTLLLAYEHGSQVPDAFVAFQLQADHTVKLRAVKGNYFHKQEVSAQQSYQTVWLQVAAVNGSEAALAEAYRTFVLKHMTLNLESRKPYIFYNTWAYQERNKWWNGRTYLQSMQQERILQEIDIAHRMGIEVFVLDTGWYDKTGDWMVNERRFPNGLKTVKEKLDGYGMKLGLWFDPTKAAVSSKMLQEHRDCVMTWKGGAAEPRPVWETEESHRMCLVSRYSDAFAEELIRLVKEVGVSYFKWDAIGQYGCDNPGHWHGSDANSDLERADCYAFQLGLEMSRIVDRLCQACPQAIVDFDITEGHRYMGLGFLAAGKYFLNNNGPYYANYDVPLPKDEWTNIFVYPGPARTWICRTPLNYDKWIPSVLFLTHYLPDDPDNSQIINIASLILGQNGIWGDLLGVSDEGINLFGKLLGLYKQVRDDLTESVPIRDGAVGSSPEIHEKISRASGRGAVVAFSSSAGRYVYVTHHAVASTYWHNEGVSVSLDHEGRAKLELEFEGAGAKIILFGSG